MVIDTDTDPEGLGEEHRRRVASALCLIGVALILVGVALAIQQQGGAEGDDRLAGAPQDSRLQLAEVMQRVLFWVVVLAGIFALSTFAFLRWSRSFRRWVLRRPRPPTVVEDVWAMHRLPDESDESDESPEEAPGESPPSDDQH